jgi:PilZ domain
MTEKTENAAVETSRADPRYPASALPGITGMRLSPGDTVRLLNMSVSGVLVEGKTRFVPGTRVSVIFEGPNAPKNVKGKVVRCQVSSIGGGGSLQYQSAIAFEAKIELPLDESALPAQAPAADAIHKPSGKAHADPAPAAVNRW